MIKTKLNKIRYKYVWGSLRVVLIIEEARKSSLGGSFRHAKGRDEDKIIKRKREKEKNLDQKRRNECHLLKGYMK